MIARNPYTIKTSYVSAVSGEIDSGTLASTTYNIGYYDDTKLIDRMSLLESSVDEIKSHDANFSLRLQKLESNESKYALKTTVESIDRRVTVLENNPVGLTNSQINTIFN